MMKVRRLNVGLALWVLSCLVQPAAFTALAQTTPQKALADALAAYGSLSPVPAPAGFGLAEAEEVQRMLVLNLRPHWGEVAGYKAALTSPGAQARFGVSHPVAGVFLANMFTTTGSIINRGAAIRPVVEADLLFRVGTERINEAIDESEILDSISEVIPFIEVADLMYADPAKLNAPSIVAINAGARFGVMGVPIAINALNNPREALGRFNVELLDANGHSIASGNGSALMGHPLTAALWLKNDIARQGYRIRVGDLLSLGSLTAPIPAKDLVRVTASYRDLTAEPAEVHLGFSDGQ